MFLSAASTWVTNKVMLKPLLLTEMEDNDMIENYFSLDLNAEMMRQDLREMGIELK